MGGQENIRAEMIPLTTMFVMRIPLPLQIIDIVNGHIDRKKEQDKISAASKLAGEIQSGEQTELDPEDKELSVLKEVYLAFAENYLQNWSNRTIVGKGAKESGHEIFLKKSRIELKDMWYNVYHEGDYNPLHNHATESRMGLSSFLFLKLPDCLEGRRVDDSSSFQGSRGDNDGLTYFNYGQSTGHDVYDLVCTQNIVVEPKIGDLWLFPKWLEHGVYPFRGEGERRTLAANLNIWFD